MSPMKLSPRHLDRRISRIHRQVYLRCAIPMISGVLLILLCIHYFGSLTLPTADKDDSQSSIGSIWDRLRGTPLKDPPIEMNKRKQIATDNAKFQQIAPVYGFVFFNGYRMSKHKFAAVGIGGLRLRDTRKINPCYFVSAGPNSRTILGRVSVYYPGEHHDLTYESIVIQCSLPEDSGSDMAGSVYVTVDDQDLLIYTENKRTEPVDDPKAPFKHHVTFCSPPIYGAVETIRIYEWIEYHIKIGMEHLIMYDAGGIDDELAYVLEPYIKKGMMEVVNATETLFYDTWLYTQVALMNDCAYRTRYTSKWSMFMDFDEYWIAHLPNIKFGHLLDEYDGKSHVTFGSMWWSVKHCSPSSEEGEWPVERMVYHWPKTYCQNLDKYKPDLCLDYFGHRKYAVNPRMVTALQIHRPEIPQDDGIDLNTEVARMNHFQGLIRKNGTLCANVVNAGESVEWWKFGDNISRLTRKSRIGKPYVSMEEAKLEKPTQ